MARFPLMQGAYQARGPLASAQVCINLYPENNPQDAPFPVTHYPAPGLTTGVNITGDPNPVRGLYVTSDGAALAATSQTIYYLSGMQAIGSIPTNSGNPVIFCDNGSRVVAVDGTSWGWIANLDGGGGVPTGGTQINDPAFYGANRVDFIDTFLVFNQPGTRNFYSTTSNTVLPFDATYFASKVGWNDLLVSLAVLHDNIWLLGRATTEIWYNAGGSTFPFARMPNSILQQGCSAPYSAVVADNALYWLSEDRWGRSMMMRGEGYSARRVSTFALEDIWAQYPAVTDCIGMAYQIGGHETVGFLFPTANAWWAYDASTQLWHQRTYATSGNAWLPRCTAYWPGAADSGQDLNSMLAGDRTSGRILGIDRNTYLDAGNPILRQRSWPHTQTEGNRGVHTRFALNMQGANLYQSGAPYDIVNLDWSDDLGTTFNTPVPQTINNQPNGQYLWRRLGYTRDRVYRISLTGAGEFGFNGAWVDVIPQGT